MERVTFKLFRRKLILTTTMVGTFEVKDDKINATEWIPLSTITSCVNPVVEKGDPEGLFMFVRLILFLRAFTGKIRTKQS